MWDVKHAGISPSLSLAGSLSLSVSTALTGPMDTRTRVWVPRAGTGEQQWVAGEILAQSDAGLCTCMTMEGDEVEVHTLSLALTLHTLSLTHCARSTLPASLPPCLPAFSHPCIPPFLSLPLSLSRSLSRSL